MKHFYCIIFFGLLFTNIKSPMFYSRFRGLSNGNFAHVPRRIERELMFYLFFKSFRSNTIMRPHGGGPHNTLWWSFVSGGGPVTITIDLNNLRGVNGTGIHCSIWITTGNSINRYTVNLIVLDQFIELLI